jgi:hypothetical protein
MSDKFLSDDVRNFILEYIDSVAQLEALLLLHKYAEQDWTMEAVAKRLYVSEAVASEVLARLAGDGLCMCGDQFFRYCPSSEERAATIDRLCDAYTQYLIPVTNLVHSKPARIKKFADAFRFRKDK